jgi:hypothetical protein
MKKIPLTQGFAALVDDADFLHLATFNWCVTKGAKKQPYARRQAPRKNGRQQIELMHRRILAAPEGFEVDHRDGNGLNNQRYNLRLVPKFRNRQAFRRKSLGKSSRFRGVFWNTQVQKWHARIEAFAKRYHLGTFETEEDAARAYDAAAKIHFGEFAQLNFP